MSRLRTTQSRLTLTALGLVLLSVLVFGRAETWAQGYAWAKSYGAGGREEAWNVHLTSDGGYAVAAWIQYLGAGNGDFWVFKLRQDGTVQWEKTYGGHHLDVAFSILQTSDGGYAVAGYTASFGAGGRDVWVLKLREDGSIHWQKAYGGQADDQAMSIQQTSDGGYVVAGETKSFGAGDWDVWILKLDENGTVQWQKTYGGTKWDSSAADPIQQTSDGGYVVTGQTESFGAGGFDVWVLKLDGDGTIQWEKTYGSGNRDMAHSIRQTLGGGYVVGGHTWSYGGGNYSEVWVLKLDGDGMVQWQKTYGGREQEFVWSVWETSDGGCVVTGNTRSFGAGWDDVWVLKLAADGTVHWEKTYGGLADDLGGSIRQTSDGGYVVAGRTQSFGAGGWDFWVLKLDEEGNIPGCPLVAASSAVVRDTGIHAVGSAARVLDSGATVRDTDTSPADTRALVSVQCYHEPTPTHTLTLTPTPTSDRPPPNPPVLTSPEDGALLPQPVPPNEWVFQWTHGGGPPADYRVEIAGPGGRYIQANRSWWEPRTYTYTSDVYIPDDALGPWYWRVDACGSGGTSSSETRTFSVMRAPTPGWTIYLPVLLRNHTPIEAAPGGGAHWRVHR